VGKPPKYRFDHPSRTATDPGVCYLATSLEGVLLERVLRDAVWTSISLAKAQAGHAVSQAVVTRDLVLIDLLAAVHTVHHLEMSEITAPPPYASTQALAAGFAKITAPHIPDGIAYGSRFGALFECIALWDRATSALAWSAPEPLGKDDAALRIACENLGLDLDP
jgi:hypothetical protein